MSAADSHLRDDVEQTVDLHITVPADLYMLRDRGRLVEGADADVIVFDEHEISSNPMEMRADLPAGAACLDAAANGIDHVLCNGVEIVQGTEFTDARSGIVLRAGTHTG